MVDIIIMHSPLWNVIDGPRTCHTYIHIVQHISGSGEEKRGLSMHVPP